MQKELEDFGLSEKEAKVYLASLAIGKATADQLAKQSGIKRPTAYVQIQSLSRMGLMSTFEEGKKTFFVPESPEGLKRLLAQKKEEVHARENELSTVLPDLLRAFASAGERPMVRFFEGKEGITAMREETLSLKKDEEIRIIYSYDALTQVYSGEELHAYTKRRIEKGIKVKLIYTKEGKSLEPSNITPMAVRKFISIDRMRITSDFFVYKDRVAVMALKGRIFGIVIESKEIADSMRVFFDLLWSQAEEDQA